MRPMEVTVCLGKSYRAFGDDLIQAAVHLGHVSKGYAVGGMI